MQFEKWEGPSRRQRGHRRRGPGGTAGGPWGAPWGGPMAGPPWAAHLFGPEWGGRPSRGGRGPRVRRGDVRHAILGVLADAGEPVNGYQVIQEIAERTEGLWKPSPGSVYPTIAQLEDEGLVDDAPTGRKAVQLTEAGRQYVGEHASAINAVWEPFTAASQDEESVNFKQVIKQTVGAVVQVMQAGTPEQWDRAVEILDDTRRRLYGLLAEGPDPDADVEPDDGPDEGPETHREP